MKNSGIVLLASTFLGGCSFLQSLGHSSSEKPARIEEVITQIKADLRGIDLSPIESTSLSCGLNENASLKLSLVSVQLTLQNTEVVDKAVDASGKNIPIFGIPISPGISAEAKNARGDQIDITFLVPTPLAESAADPKAVTNPELGELIRGAELGIVNAVHSKPCLKVEGQTLTVTRSFELTRTDQVQSEFGFKVLYSAGFKASHASDVKNTITVKMLMSGTDAMIP